MFLFTNRAKTQLARNVGVNDTTLTLMSGGGALFPSPSGSNDLFPLTLASANNPDNYEITYCIARNGDVLTVQRGQEGTTARSFMSGDVASLNATATTYRRLAQAGHLGTFSPEVAATQGGYKRGAIVNDDSVATTYWINLQDGNTTHPGPDNPTWQEFDSAALVHENDVAFFVSGQGYGGDNLNITRLWRGARGAICVRDQNGTVTLLQENGDYATYAALNSEIQRAQNAEAGLNKAVAQCITGHGYSDGDSNVLNIWRNNQGGLSANIADGSVAIIPKTDDLANMVTSLPYASDFQINRIGVNKSSGQIWGFNTADDRYFYFQPAGDYATQNALNAETQRAQAAEATLQPRGDYALRSDLANMVVTEPDAGDFQINRIGVNKASGQIWGYNTANNTFFYFQSSGECVKKTGDSMSGSLVIADMTGNDSQLSLNAAYGRNAYVRVQGFGAGYYLAGITDTDANNYRIVSSDKNNNFLAWQFSRYDQTLRAPSGNPYLEVAADGRRLVQSFSTTGSEGQWIAFPQQFASDDVQVFVMPQDTGNGNIHVANYFYVTGGGLSLSLNVWTGGTFTNQSTPIPLKIIAIGAK